MINRFKSTALARQLRRLYMKQRGILQYILVKSVLRQHVRVQKEQFQKNLVILHDILEESEFASRYWVWGGVLLGWAREGQILDHDYCDADFAYFSEDREKFLRSIERIVQAGFQPLARWKNNNNEITEYTFFKDGAKFEFFEMYKRDGAIWFYNYSKKIGVQTAHAVSVHGLASMEFIGRTWLKPDDHEAYLTALYGNWRKPDPSWDFLEDDKSIREKTRWIGTQEEEWSWAQENPNRWKRTISRSRST